MGFRSVQKSVTLHDFERLNGHLRYSAELSTFRGQLHKSG